jgi:hypothetical protein
MNPTRRLTAAVAGLAGALLAFAAVAPAALARPFPPRPPGWDKHPPLPLGHVAGIHVVGGMPGWQIALIAIGAALLAASAAAGIIAKRGGSPVRRPRAKMSASAPPAGPPGTFRATGPSPAAARTRRHMPPRRRPRPRPVLAIGEEHRVPGRQETTHVHTHSPPGTLPAGSSATGRRATVPARRGPFSATGGSGSSRWPCGCCSWSSSPWCSPAPPRSRAGRSAPRSATSPASSRWRSSAPHPAIQLRVLDPYSYTLEVM